MKDKVTMISGLSTPGSTITIIKNGIYTFAPGIQVNKEGNRIPVGALSVGLKTVENCKYVRLEPSKTILERKMEKTAFSVERNTTDSAISGPVILMTEHSVISPFGLVKFSIINDEIQKYSRGPFKILSGKKPFETNVQEVLFALKSGKQANYTFGNGERIRVAFMGSCFEYSYQ